MAALVIVPKAWGWPMSNAPRVVVVLVLLLAGGSGAATPLSDGDAWRMVQATPRSAEEPSTEKAPAEKAPAAGDEADKADKADEEPAKTVLGKDEIQGILGKVVRDSDGKEMGRIVNVIVDRNSRPRAVVIDFGGFLGVGSRKIAVDWNALKFGRGEEQDQIALDLTRDQVKTAPEYKEGQPVVVLGAAGGTRALPTNGPEKAEP